MSINLGGHLFGVHRVYLHVPRSFGKLNRGAFCQFPFRWIYYYGSNKYTGKETGKTQLCALVEKKCRRLNWPLCLQ